MVEQLLTRNSADNGGKPCHVFKVCVNGQAVFWFFSYIYKFAVQSRCTESDSKYVHMTAPVQLSLALPSTSISSPFPWSHKFFLWSNEVMEVWRDIYTGTYQCKSQPPWKLVQTMTKKPSKFTKKITHVDDMMIHNLVKYLIQTRLCLWDIKITNF